jgi:hypothetical protein
LSSRELAAALLGVLGIYLLGQSITFTLSFILYHQPDSDQLLQPRWWYWVRILMIAIFFAWQFTFGAALVLLRNRIAALLCPEPSQPGAPIGVSDVQAALFAVLGLGFVVRSVNNLIYDFTQLSADQGITALWPDSAESIAGGVLGIALFLGARGIAGAWSLARQAGGQPRVSD